MNQQTDTLLIDLRVPGERVQTFSAHCNWKITRIYRSENAGFVLCDMTFDPPENMKEYLQLNPEASLSFDLLCTGIRLELVRIQSMSSDAYSVIAAVSEIRKKSDYIHFLHGFLVSRSAFNGELCMEVHAPSRFNSNEDALPINLQEFDLRMKEAAINPKLIQLFTQSIARA